MASTFAIAARRPWRFQLVLLGSRMRLEGCCEVPEPGGELLCCSAWLDPQQAPMEVAHALIQHPSCCL